MLLEKARNYFQFATINLNFVDMGIEFQNKAQSIAERIGGVENDK